MKRYILSIDSGGRSIRAFLFNNNGKIVARASVATPSVSLVPGAQEHDPITLWESFVKVVKIVLKENKIPANEIESIGISTQRASFLLWEKESGKPVSPIISWADVRAADTVDKMNKNFIWRIVQKVTKFIAFWTNSQMMRACSMLKFTTDHASTRLKWFLDNNIEIKKRCINGEILFGTTDSWFIYNLTNKQNHLTDTSNAAASSMFNPFQLKWNPLICKTFGIPMNILPKVLDSNGDFGKTDKKIFGEEIPIRASMGDQMAALFGHCGFEKGVVKISQGSGAFVDLNVGCKAKLSKRGLFPLIAWTINGKTKYMLEGYVATAGTLIDWLGQGIGLSSSGKELDAFALKCNDTDGVVVVPTASGIRFPYFNPRTKAAIFGLSLSTHRSHVARAVLEGIAFRLIDIISGMKKDTKTPIKKICVDGGVSNSDILLQSLANYSNICVERAPEPDMSATGAAYMAGLATGFYKDYEKLLSFKKSYKKFECNIDESVRVKKIKEWNKVVKNLVKL